MSKSAEAFRTIGEVAEELDIPKHVLRFWEGKFPQIRPMKRGGGRRYYRPEDTELLRGIRHLLHAEGYTIKGVQKILREQGIDEVKSIVRAAMEARGQGGPKRKGRKPLAGQDLAHGPAVIGGRTPAETSSGKSSASVAASARAGASRDVIAAAIRELKACRAILAAAMPPGSAKEGELPKRAAAGRS